MRSSNAELQNTIESQRIAQEQVAWRRSSNPQSAPTAAN